MISKASYQGVHLNFKVSGPQKGPAFILIHNAGGNHRFMDPQFSHLTQQSSRVLSMDLRGHGDSDKSAQSYTVETFARDIAFLCQTQEIQKASIIALNYGSAIAVELANLNPSLASHLILIDPPILMESWIKQRVDHHIAELRDPVSANFAESLIESIFQNASRADKLMAIQAFNTIPREILISVYENLLKWDKTCADKIRNCHMPVLNIQTSHPFCQLNLLQELCPHVILGKVASGPWATLEVPSQINAIIDKFLISE